MKSSRVFLLGMFLTLSSLAFSQAKVVPSFTFQRLDNSQTFTEANLVKGKKLMFLFFDAECSHCRDAVAVYNKQESKLNDPSIYILTRNTKASFSTFLKTYAPALSRKKNVTILYDGNLQFLSKFLPRKLPSMFLYGKDRKLIIYSDEEKDIPSIISKAKG